MEKTEQQQNRLPVILAWISMFIASSFVVIIWQEFFGDIPKWWPWIHVGILSGFFILSFLHYQVKPLRTFILILLIIFLLGYGGGWQWGLIPYIRSTSAWIIWESQVPWAFSAIITHILRLTPAFVILCWFLLSRQKFNEFYLIKGDVKAMVEPSKLLGMKEPKPWYLIGSIFAGVFFLGTLIFLLITKLPTWAEVLEALPLIPVALGIAAINAFNEEFTLRAAPLSSLIKTLGKKQALLITTIYFGIGHYYGVPNGIIGVCLAAFLGWFAGKSLVETRGFVWAWFIHFLPDTVIFIFYAISS